MAFIDHPQRGDNVGAVGAIDSRGGNKRMLTAVDSESWIGNDDFGR
jgi:hypothetical protein